MKLIVKLVHIIIIVILILSCTKITEEELIDQLKDSKNDHKALEIFEKLIEIDPIVAFEIMIERLKERIKGIDNYNFISYHHDGIIFDKLIEINPNNAEIYYLRAIFPYVGIDNLSDYNRAIELDPENYFYYYARGNYFSWDRQYSKAIKDYSKSVELEPHLIHNDLDVNNEPTLSIAVFEYAVNNNLTDWLNNRTITANGETLDVFFAIGLAYRKLMDHDNTILYMTKSINANKNKAMPFYLRGDAYWAKQSENASIIANQNIQKAADDLVQSFMRGDTNLPKTTENKSVSRTDQNAQMAVNDWRQAKRINPNIQWNTADSSYQEIDPFDFEVKYRYSNNSREINFKSTVTFSFNDGPRYFFKSLQGDTDLVLFSSERIDGLWRGRRVTVYWVYNPNVQLLDIQKTNSIAVIVF